MGEYAVTITSVTSQPAVEVEALLDSLLDALPTDAALSFAREDREISATVRIDAADVYSASGLGGNVLSEAMRAVGVELFRDLEVHSLDWDLHEQRLAVSNLPDLVSAPDVGEILGVSRQRVHQLLNENPSFPPPILRLGSGPLWLRPTIEAFERSWTRKPGRPRVAS
jgi:predicted DNA-binding transcriptional regulator AlpA